MPVVDSNQRLLDIPSVITMAADELKEQDNLPLQYISYLQEKGITHYSSQFEGDTLVSAVKVMQRRLLNTDTEVYLGRTEDDKYVMLIKIGEDSLKGMFE